VTGESDWWVDGYLRQAALAQPLSREEAVLLTRRVHKGDAEARESLVTAGRRLVVMTARKYVHATPNEKDWDTRSSELPDTDQLADLLPRGEKGVQTAVDRFDESKGFSFPTYAIWWIRQAIEETEGGDPAGDREPRSPVPRTPTRAAQLDLPASGS
jgi:DNA-directed RNA polymerase specialized sigma subunit